MTGVMSAVAPLVLKSIPVHNTGWSPTTYVMSIVAIGIFSLLGYLIKNQPKIREINSSDSSAVNVILMDRVAKVEADMAEQLKQCAREQAEMRTEWENERNRMRREWEVERDSMRNQIRGLQAQIIQYQITRGGAFPLNISSDQKALVDKIVMAMENPVEKRSILRRKRKVA